MGDFKGKRVWLTGASSGIGEALALELATRGAEVHLSARRADVLEALAGRIRSAGGAAFAVPCDVTDREKTLAAAKSIAEAHGPIDIVVANAGTYVPSEPHERFDSDEYEAIMRLNYGGVLHAIEGVLPGMIARASGHVVGVSSLVGYRGLPRAAAYGASKAAVINFLESLRFHTMSRGVDVTIVNPGFVETPLTNKNDFEMPFLVPAARAARIIADGILRRRMEVHFPAPFSWTFKFMRILPYPLYHALIGRKVAR